MSGKYEDLEKLKDLLDKGYFRNRVYHWKEKFWQRSERKSKTTQQISTKDNNSFCALMHLSQFANYLLSSVGLLAPIVMWLTRRNEKQRWM